MKKLKHREVKSFASVTQLIKYGTGLTQKDSQVRALIFLHGIRWLTWDYMGVSVAAEGSGLGWFST